MSSDDAATLRVMRLREGALLPARQSADASGFDLHACLAGPELETGLELGLHPMLVPTGLAVAALPGLDLQIRPRSGLSARGVIAVLGTLDADYRGELFVTLYCLPGAAGYRVRHGERVAQLVVSRLAPVVWQEVATLDETARGTGGHGSTGAL